MEKYNISIDSFKYALSEKEALNNISLSVKEGEFVIIAGLSGSSKTTLIRMLKTSISPKGEFSGKIEFEGRNLNTVPFREQTEKIGYVNQFPDAQSVSDSVWHEISFGCENLGFPPQKIRMMCGETCAQLGISDLWNRKTDTLSGGEKQLVNLAAVIAMAPNTLLLDEPCSNLDPSSSEKFYDAVDKLNKEQGITVILSEHNPEYPLRFADRIIFLDSGKISGEAKPQNIMSTEDKTGFIKAVAPDSMKILNPFLSGELPLTVRDAENDIEKLLSENKISVSKSCFPKPENDSGQKKEYAIKLKDVSFRYEKKGCNIIENTTLSVKKGKITALVGANGSGKSTLLKLCAKVYKPQSGKLTVNGKTALLPQDPLSLFFKQTIEDNLKISADEKEVYEISEKFGIKNILSSNPFDVSGGEIQRAAAAKTFLAKPDILILDEPTKGMDKLFVSDFEKILRDFTDSGRTVLLVTHDMKFLSETADEICFFFDKNVSGLLGAREFLYESRFFTTDACKIMRKYNDAVTADEALKKITKI